MTSLKPKNPCRRAGHGLRGLTAREKEVLRQVERGATNREIAVALQISCHTVKTHLDHIFRKLDVQNRTQAAMTAARRNRPERAR